MLNILRISICMIFTFVSLNVLPAKSDCGDKSPNDIDKECNTTQCGGSESEIKGCYLPPDKKNCPEDYPDHKDICCCKEKEK